MEREFWDFPSDTAVKNPPASTGDAGSISRLGRSPGEGNANPLQLDFQLGNLMDRGAWRTTVNGASYGLAVLQLQDLMWSRDGLWAYLF